MRRLLYMIRQAGRNVINNRLYTLASVGTITACLFLFGVFFVLGENLDYMVKNAESNMTITVLFQEGIQEETLDRIHKKLEERPEVKDIRYISADEAWENFKGEIFKDHEEYADTFKDDNPLADSASYEVTTKRIEDQTELVQYIKTLEGVRQVNSAEHTVESLETLNLMVSWGSGGIFVIMLLVSIFLTSITVAVGIARKKEEIRVLRLLGANDLFIQGPYVFEGMLLGLLGSLIPIGILYLVYSKVMNYVLTHFEALSGFLDFLDVGDVFSGLAPMIMLIGVGIGLAGSFLTVKRHLKY